MTNSLIDLGKFWNKINNEYLLVFSHKILHFFYLEYAIRCTKQAVVTDSNGTQFLEFWYLTDSFRVKNKQIYKKLIQS